MSSSTGATGGIGREVTKAFAAAGARVMVVDLLASECERLVDELDGAGHASQAVDLSEVSGHEGLVDKAQHSLGEVFALVHLAAVLRRRPQLPDVTGTTSRSTPLPGLVRTSMLLTDFDPQLLESMTQATPLGRIAEPSEMAGLAVFLASRHAGFITGATINITGGFLMY